MTSLSVEGITDALPHSRAYLSSPAAVSSGFQPADTLQAPPTRLPTSSLRVRVFSNPVVLWELGLPQ